MMDNRTARFAGSSQQPSRSILKPSRSSHARQPSRSPPSSSNFPSLPTRRTVQIVDDPEPQLIRGVAAIPSHGPIPEMTITFPAAQNTEQLQQLISDFAKQVMLRRRHQESHLAHDHRILNYPTPRHRPPSAGRPTRAPDEYHEFRQILMGPWQAGANCMHSFYFLEDNELSFNTRWPNLQSPRRRETWLSSHQPSHLH